MDAKRTGIFLTAVIAILTVILILPVTAHAAAEVTLMFSAGEGTGEMEDVNLTCGSKYTLPECEFTAPEGKEFDRWFVTILAGAVPYIGNETEDGLYSAGETIVVPYISNPNFRAEARWKDKYYNVNFVMNGAKAQQEAQRVKLGDPVQKPYSVPHRPGYTFENWYTDETLETVYDFDHPAPVTEDMTLYAGWGCYASAFAGEKGVKTFSSAGAVSVNGKEGSRVSVDLVLDGRTADYSASEVDPRYHFAGWYKNDGAVIPAPTGEVLYTDPDFTVTVNDDLYYCAVFERHKAFFDTRGGSTVEPAAVDDEGRVKEPKRPLGPTSEYSFEGWYTDTDFRERFDFNTVLTGDVTLYARYRVSTSVSPYNEDTGMTSGGGRVKISTSSRYSEYGESKTGYEGEQVTILAEADDGYELVGWAKDWPDGEIVTSTNDYTFTIDGPHTFYAVFSQSHIHEWGDWEVLRQPTETESGEARRVCKLDPDHVQVISLFYDDGGDDGLDGGETGTEGGAGSAFVSWITAYPPLCIGVIALAAAVAAFLIDAARRKRG